MDVQFSGIKLDDVEKYLVNALSDKFCKGCLGLEALHIDIKQHKKAGDRSTYTTHLRAELGKGNVKTAEVTDWDFAKSVRTAFKKLGKELAK